jgi:hypothetical protein
MPRSSGNCQAQVMMLCILGGIVKKSGQALQNGKEKLLKSTVLYDGPIFGVRRDELIEP